MNTYLRIVLCIAVVIYFILVLHFIKKRLLALKYALLWIAAGMIMGALVAFPVLLEYFSKAVGIQTPMNGLLVAALIFVIFILMSLTSIVSIQTDKIKNLTQKTAMYEKRLRTLEKLMEKEGSGVSCLNHDKE